MPNGPHVCAAPIAGNVSPNDPNHSNTGVTFHWLWVRSYESMLYQNFILHSMLEVGIMIGGNILKRRVLPQAQGYGCGWAKEQQHEPGQICDNPT